MGLKILKFKGILHLQNYTLVSQPNTSKHEQTQASAKNILDTPIYKKKLYGPHSAKYHCIVDCKQFKRTFLNLSESDDSYSSLKSLIKWYFLNKY